MRFPNKVNPYRTTVVYAMELVLENLSLPKKSGELIVCLKKCGLGAELVVDGLTCLFALGKINIDGSGVISKC